MSRRISELPSNWYSIRKYILKRDKYKCQSCGSIATDVDHIFSDTDHSYENLQSLCKDCHNSKTGRYARHTQIRRLYRDKEVHPFDKL